MEGETGVIYRQCYSWDFQTGSCGARLGFSFSIYEKHNDKKALCLHNVTGRDANSLASGMAFKCGIWTPA